MDTIFHDGSLRQPAARPLLHTLPLGRTWLAILLFLAAALPSLAQGRHQRHGKRPTVALVLGGGGAKGAAEVGVLKAIERSGVPIDYIVGTSIGSIVGGLYSLGYRSADLDSLFTNQNWLHLFNDIGVKGGDRARQIRGFGLLKGKGVLEFLDTLCVLRPAYKGPGRYPDSIFFDHMPIPYRAVATDVRGGQAVALSQGSLPMAMRSSMSIPGAFKPVRIDSLVLLDGGVVNNLPVDVARAMGADYVIAVDLTQNKHPDYKPKTIRKAMPKGVKWMRSRPDFVNYNRNREDCDVYINPNLKGYGASSFKGKAIRAMIALGQQAGEEKLGELVRLRKKVLGK